MACVVHPQGGPAYQARTIEPAVGVDTVRAKLADVLDREQPLLSKVTKIVNILGELKLCEWFSPKRNLDSDEEMQYEVVRLAKGRLYVALMRLGMCSHVVLYIRGLTNTYPLNIRRPVSY